MKRSGHGAGFSTWGFFVEKNALAAGHLMLIIPFYKNILSYKLPYKGYPLFQVHLI
jgi:hypothetical protein